MAGTDHARALADIPAAAVIAGIDTDPARGPALPQSGLPVYPSVFDAASEHLDPDIVVVATPTGTHAQVCSDVSEYFPRAAIIVEKPAASNLEDSLRIVTGVGGKQQVTVAYHMAFSPEVEWALGETAARAGQLGTPVAIESWNADPYQPDLASATTRLGTSWIDSGINSLSVIERFAKPVARTSLRQIGAPSRSLFEGIFTCQAGSAQLTAIVLTSWYSTAQTRSTRIRYSSGAEVVMDHNAVAGFLLQDGRASAMFGSDGAIPRRESHYRAFYRSWLAAGIQAFPQEASLRLHRLLLGGDG